MGTFRKGIISDHGAILSEEMRSKEYCPICRADHWLFPNTCAAVAQDIAHNKKLLYRQNYLEGTPQYVDEIEEWKKLSRRHIDMKKYLKLWEDDESHT